ncbi:hypothetical protein M1L60_03730 [Actinoplanes sp. TRM 88003]|uniref:Lipoprotein n=1 Tax=Paractinoplanes aksuensis TaxID=2939490 RepID=A0ABT1DFY1_9ACTN|nr:hypothetical protein [Actinoplanes aksuensis]MCO8269699.1 hypothetical protein [Actinoplanes aksuensis]
MRGRRLVPLAVLVAVVAGGCTSGRDVTGPVPTGRPVTLPTPVARVEAYALDQFMVRPAQANDLDTVVKRLARACMLSRGVDWRGGGRNEFDLLRDRSHRFGLDDVDLAASVGYHWHATSPPTARWGLDDCLGQAYQTLGWAADEFRWLEHLADQTVEQTYADPRSAAVTRRWSECMDNRYPRPRDAEADPRWWRAEPHADEKPTAVADARCKAQVRYAEQLGGVLAVKQVDAVRANAHRLESFRRMATAAATKADALRGDRQPPPPRGSGSPLPPGNWRIEHAPE